jgi:probable HAF family extracellular repeat protein
MLYRSAIVLCALLLAVLAVRANAASLYFLTDLAPVTGSGSSYAYAAARVGGTVEIGGRTGGSSLPITGDPALWSGGTATDLLPTLPTTVPGDSRTLLSGQVLSIAGNGDIAGRAVYGVIPSSYVQRPFYLLNGSGSATVLPVLDPSNPYGVANSLNSAGQIAGTSRFTDGNMHAAVWTSSGGNWSVTDLGGLETGVASYAYGIGSNGHIVGYGSHATAPDDAAMWTWSGSAWTITNLNPNRATTSPCKGSSYAYAVNAVGDAIGYGWTEGGISLNRDAFLFKNDGTIVKLGSFSNAGTVPEGYARAINTQGVVVGDSMVSSGHHAFVSNGTANSLQDLNNMLVPGTGTGWNLQYAYGIDDGGHIVGYGTTAAGVTHAFLLTPTLAGDATLDGVVDISDLSKLLANYDKSGMNWTGGDFNSDTVVDISDLSNVLANYDKTGGLSGAGIHAVPEPSSLTLIAIAVVGSLGCIWRRFPR